jgi:hypothetical protein
MPQVPLEGDERWIARSVRFVATGVGLAIVASLLQHGAGEAGRGLSVAVLASELLVLGVVLLLNRRGVVQGAARLLALSLPLLAAALMLGSGQGFRDVAVLILPASLILCGLLLDRVSLTAVTLLTLACSTGVLYAEARGMLGRRIRSPRARTPSTPRSSWW